MFLPGVADHLVAQVLWFHEIAGLIGVELSIELCRIGAAALVGRERDARRADSNVHGDSITAVL